MAAEIKPPIDKANEALALQARVRDGSLAMQFNRGGIQLNKYEDAINFCKQMVDSGFAPKGVTRASSVLWMIQRGAELSLGPTASMDAFYIPPSGKPRLYVEAALGICLASGALDPEYDLYHEGEGENLVGHFKFKRRGWQKEKHQTFSLKEAQTAGLVKPDSNYKKYPQDMLEWRAAGKALHKYFGEILLGCSIQGDPDREAQAEITEVSRESLRPAAPDPLLAQLDESEAPAGATWDEVLDQPKVEPEPDALLSERPYTDQERSDIAASMFPLTDLPPVVNPEPPRPPSATKERQDWFYSLCRSHGLTDIQILTRLGTAGFETIDQVPADVLEGMIKKVAEYKPKAKK